MVDLHGTNPPNTKDAHRLRSLRREGAVTTASATPSFAGRIRTYALAGTLAVGLLFPIFQVAQADSPTEPTVSSDGLTISVETVDQLTGLTAVVASGGENVHLRAEATSDSESVASIPDGSVVELRVDMIDTVYDAGGVRWWPVTFEGNEGWLSGEFLTQATTAEGDIVSSSLVAFEYPDEATALSTAKVFGNGQQVNVRAEPSATAEIVTKAADGEVISLRIDMVDTVYDTQGTRWWPVTVNGLEGWISGFYLSDSEGAPTSNPNVTPAATATEATTPGTTTPAPTAVPTEDAASGFEAGDFAQVFTGNGDGVNVRASGDPTAEIVGQLADGEVVRIVSGPVSFDASEAGWYEVTNNNATGFVDGDLLVSSVEASSTATTTPTEPPLSEEEEATAAATQQPTEEATEEPTEEATEEPAPTETPEQSSSAFIYPLENYTRTQGFGCSNLGFYSYNAEYGCAVHNGLDLAAPSGTDILAAGSGTVVTAGWCNCGLGYYVEIDHGDGVHTLYGHMASQPYVRAGASVSQGDVIGPVGSTGISTGPHTHFMVTVNGSAKDPENYLP
jgi:murein DD-endopeptidase MepM/ murein hydrolase activator NlpD